MAEVGLERSGRHFAGAAFRGVTLAGLAISLLILLAVLAEMVSEGWPVLSSRLPDFLSSGNDVSSPAAAGVWQGIKGTMLLALIVAATSFPIGVGAALYLEEYARPSRVTRVVNLNIRNLAGVPSIVYGLLGLAIFVKALSGPANQGGITGGRTVVSGGLTLAALVLPIVIITSQEAIRAVPAGLREGSLALGATQWETIRRTVMPAALPGVLTGCVISLARSAGEAAPLLVVGASTGFFSTGSLSTFQQVFSGPFTALPMNIFAYARLPASAGWGAAAAASGVVLLVLIFVMNGVAIFLRNRAERSW